MGRYTQGRISDYTQNFINIDVLCDVLTNAQKEAGIKPTFKLKEKYAVENESENTKVDKEEKEEKHKCDGSCNKCNESKLPFHELLGIYEDDDDDEDDFYLCEYCSSLGYKKNYDQSVCDQCTVCLSCNQYDSECSGCSYSRFRDGEYYSNKLTDEELLSESDLSIFNNVSDRNVDKDRLQMSSFSILR